MYTPFAKCVFVCVYVCVCARARSYVQVCFHNHINHPCERITYTFARAHTRNTHTHCCVSTNRSLDSGGPIEPLALVGRALQGLG